MTFFEINKPLRLISDRKTLFVITLALSAIVLGSSNIPHVMAVPCTDTNQGIYVDYDTNFADHGTLISICDRSSTALAQNWIPVTIASLAPDSFTTSDPNNNPNNFAVFAKNSTGWFTIAAGTLSNQLVPGYLMYSTVATNQAIPTIKISSSSSDAITITDNNVSPPLTKTISIVPSDTNIDPNYLSANTNAQPYKTKNLAGNCANIMGDGICDVWKTVVPVSSPLSNSLSKMEITWGATSSVRGVYDYYCDPSGMSVTDSSAPLGTLSNPDPVCPSPTTKDIFVEVDYMQRHHPSQSAINAVVQSFANHGIHLHVQMDEELPFHKDQMSVPSAGAPSASTDFDIWKTWFFGTPSERTSCGPYPAGSQCVQYIKNVMTIKRQFFHYAIYGHSQSVLPGSSGSSELPGNDMLITLGAFTGGVGSIDQQSGTFMHELGHNLGLYHGGAYPSLNPADDSYDNCKPNYLSVMSYSRQFSDLDPNRSLDYSSNINNNSPLQEHYLDEGMSLGSVNGQTIVWSSDGGIDILKQIPGLGYFDWNGNGVQDTTLQSVNVNNLGITGCNTSDMTPLLDHDDWSNLVLNFRGVSGFYDGASINARTGEPVPTPHDMRSDRDGHAKSGNGQSEEFFACKTISASDANTLYDKTKYTLIATSGGDQSSGLADGATKPNDGHPAGGNNAICNTVEKNDKSDRKHKQHYGLDIDSSINLRILHLQKLLKHVNSTDVSAFVTGNVTINVGNNHKAKLQNDTDDLAYHISNNEIAGTYLQLKKIRGDIEFNVYNNTASYQLTSDAVDIQTSLGKAAQPQEYYPDVVVPEFGPIAVFVLLASIIAAIFVTRSNLLIKL